MGTTIKAKPNQSMRDVILQGLGSMEGAMQFCWDNGVAISDVPVVGTVYQVSDAAIALAGAAGLSVLQEVAKEGIVFGTLGTLPAPPTMRVVLMPVLKAVATTATTPATTGFYEFNIEGDTGFIDVYGLVAGIGGYPSEPNNVHYITTDEEPGSPTVLAEVAATDMTAKSISYKVPWVTGHSNMLVFGAADPTACTTFEDTEGNKAHAWPAIILDSATQTIEQYLNPILLVELVSSAPGSVTIRLTRSHTAITFTGLSLFAMIWTDAAAGGVTGVTGRMPDPADPTNGNKMICTLLPGVYTFGVIATYAYTAGIPNTGMQCVVEVA